jgi:predicted NBD/HSP70 family sugar kinase
MEKACGKKTDTSFFDDMGKYLGVTLGNVCNLFALDKIVICGDMTGHYHLFSTTLMQHYTRTAIATHKAEITAIQITDAAYGAAKMAMDKFQY